MVGWKGPYLTSRGAPGPKLCPSVASIKQRTTVNQTNSYPARCGMQSPSGPKVYQDPTGLAWTAPGSKLCLNVATIKQRTTQSLPATIKQRTTPPALGQLRSRDGACRGLARRRQAPPLAPTPGALRTGLLALAGLGDSVAAFTPAALQCHDKLAPVGRIQAQNSTLTCPQN